MPAFKQYRWIHRPVVTQQIGALQTCNQGHQFFGRHRLGRAAQRGSRLFQRSFPVQQTHQAIGAVREVVADSLFYQPPIEQPQRAIL